MEAGVRRKLEDGTPGWRTGSAGLARPGGTKLSWENLAEQFGQEYRDRRNFKHEFKQVLREVMAVYPQAKIRDVPGGIVLLQSPPPLARTQVSLALPRPVDKPEG